MLNRITSVLASMTLGLFLVVALSSPARAETHTVTPKGEYSQIDTRLSEETMQVLSRGTSEAKRKAIDSIKASPDRYAPPVFYLLSNVLFENEKNEESAFWFYAGQLRARFDANRCADVSAQEAVGALNDQYGSLINQFMFKRLPELEELIPRVVDWDRKTPHNYDHRWINLHGMGAMMSGLDTDSSPKEPAVLSLPKEQWPKIAEKTQADYLADFKEAMAQMKKKK